MTEEIKQKIKAIREDTNAYGYDNDNTLLADVLEGLLGLNKEGASLEEASDPQVTGSDFE